MEVTENGLEEVLVVIEEVGNMGSQCEAVKEEEEEEE